jgi:Zn-dependent peptidase ImmA (M78 family)/formiminotetrahydrofolate cyclodeaminase
MNSHLMDVSVRDILEKFGAGKHTPGSGSAAALNGLLSCKLLLTVLDLTLDPKRVKRYSEHKARFEEIKTSISNRLVPRLEYLFVEDSNLFDNTIRLRKERDTATSQKERIRLKTEAQEALEKSTELPIEIAKIGLELADYSYFIFNTGFASARGDSCVALNNALAATFGSVSIVELNLHSFPEGTWLDNIKLQIGRIKKEYKEINLKAEECPQILQAEGKIRNKFHGEISKVRKLLFGDVNLTSKKIENLARRIQNALWEFDTKIKRSEITRFDMLNPTRVIELIDFKIERKTTLGRIENQQEIAGIIDRNEYTIELATNFAPEVVKFTLAHELGHALLHDKIILHRDIALDGSTEDANRSKIEREADKFAVFFLMPAKLVEEHFEALFFTEKFQITEETSVFLNFSSSVEFKKRIKSKRELSRLLASCTFYNSKNFKSLSQLFGVSVEAMAIRLEELDLVQF